jgi:hypothetical protein
MTGVWLNSIEVSMGFPLSFFIIKLNNIFFLQILLQDKHNICVLTVNIEYMWLEGVA